MIMGKIIGKNIIGGSAADNGSVVKTKNSNKSWRTAIHRKKPSAPFMYLYQQGLIKGQVLDYGCGLGRDLTFMLSAGIQAKGFDPYYLPNKLDKEIFDTIVCIYVLNVLPVADRMEVMSNIRQALKYGGHAYIAVRRDLKIDEILTTVGTKQYQVYLNIPVIFDNKKYCIYDYTKI